MNEEKLKQSIEAVSRTLTDYIDLSRHRLVEIELLRAEVRDIRMELGGLIHPLVTLLNHLPPGEDKAIAEKVLNQIRKLNGGSK